MATWTYAIGDIHGMVHLLREMIAKIFDHSKNAGVEPRFIFLGDYIDRGPDSKGVIDTLISLQQTSNCICLKGNHEDLALNAVDNKNELWLWLRNGGDATLSSYPDDKISDDHIAWMRTLPVKFEMENHIFCHAGMLPYRTLDDQFDNHLMWVREPFLESPDPFFNVDHTGARVNKFVTHGHTPWPYDDLREERSNIRCNLDSGAFYTNVLTGAVFMEDNRGPPDEIFQVMSDAGREPGEFGIKGLRQTESGLWIA